MHFTRKNVEGMLYPLLKFFYDFTIQRIGSSTKGYYKWLTSRMDVQHLPSDLVLPSSGLEELAQTMKNIAKNEVITLSKQWNTPWLKKIFNMLSFQWLQTSIKNKAISFRRMRLRKTILMKSDFQPDKLRVRKSIDTCTWRLSFLACQTQGE